MQELVDGVWAIPQTVEFEDRTVTIHPAAVETDRGLLLLDLGYPGHLDDLAATLGEAGFSLDDVAMVLLTHQDGDHAGPVATARERIDAPVLAHREAAPYVDGRKHPIKSGDERYPPAPVDVEVVDGVVVRSDAGPVEVVFTPGHAPGHVSLYLPEAGLLVAADALTAEDGVLHGPSEQFTPDMAEAARSLDRLASLEFDRVLCYHGGPVEADGDDVAAIAAGLGG